MGARPAASYSRGLIWTGKRAKKKPLGIERLLCHSA